MTDFCLCKKELPVSLIFHIAAELVREKLLRLSILRRRSVSDNLHGILARSNSGALWQPTDGRMAVSRSIISRRITLRSYVVLAWALNEVLVNATSRRSRLSGLDAVSAE